MSIGSMPAQTHSGAGLPQRAHPASSAVIGASRLTIASLYRRERALASGALASVAWGRHIMRMSEHKTDPKPKQSPPSQSPPSQSPEPATKPAPASGAREIGGPKGPEPTRYGDWEINGRCSDF